MPHSFEKIKQRLIFLETNHPEYLLWFFNNHTINYWFYCLFS
jgi:hypothetical protein